VNLHLRGVAARADLAAGDFDRGLFVPHREWRLARILFSLRDSIRFVCLLWGPEFKTYVADTLDDTDHRRVSLDAGVIVLGIIALDRVLAGLGTAPGVGETRADAELVDGSDQRLFLVDKLMMSILEGETCFAITHPCRANNSPSPGRLGR
jgi:hypothetical protein